MLLYPEYRDSKRHWVRCFEEDHQAMEDLVEPSAECAQRGFAHSHDIFTDDAIQELRAAAKLLARQHAVSVMRSKWTRVCATHRWRRIVAQRHKVRWWTCKRLTQYSKSNSNSRDIVAGVAGVLALEAPRAFVLD